MKRTVILKPNNTDRGVNRQNFQFSYKAPSGRFRVMTEDYTWKEMQQSEIEKVKSMTFSNTRPYLSYTYEDNEKKQSSFDKLVQKHCEVYLAGHPLVIVDNAPHPSINAGKKPHFKLIDIQKQSAGELSVLDKKVQVANLVNSMSEDKLRDVIYYFGGVPGDKEKDDLKIELMEFNSGTCMSPDNIDLFLDQWSNDTYATHLELVINVNKAIDHGIIVKKTVGRIENYFLGDEILGATKDQVVGYLRQKPKLYEANIKRLLKEEKPVEEKVQEEDKLDARYIQRLKDELKEGQRDGSFNPRSKVHLMKPDTVIAQHSQWATKVKMTKQTT